MVIPPHTPRQKRLAILDEQVARASSTPPAARSGLHLLPPSIVSPSSRHSSPGIERFWNGRHYADDLIPRQLTASPVAALKLKDRTRKRLANHQSIDGAVDLLKGARNIVILTGAGISTSLDIPDFRSDGGFYSKLSAAIGLTTPEEFFSLDFFKKESESFWNNVKPLLPQHVRSKDGTFLYIGSKKAKVESVPRFSKTHAFLALLHARGKLLTNYTQNIDNLESASGVPVEKIIKCHGSWDTATCLSCGKSILARKYLPIVWENGYPRCSCGGKDVAKVQKSKPKPKKRKRAVYEGDSDHSSDDGTTVPKGLFKPDITFFGEEVPNEYVARLNADEGRADLLLVIGTSLKTRPVKTMVFDFPPQVPQIWINKDRFSGYKCDLPGVQFDLELLGDCDTVIEELCYRAKLPLDDYLWNPHQTRLKDSQPNMKANTKSVKPDTNAMVNELAVRERHNCASGTDTAVNEDLSANSALPSSTVPYTKEPVVMATKFTDGTGIRVSSDLDAEWRWRFSRNPNSPVKSR